MADLGKSADNSAHRSRNYVDDSQLKPVTIFVFKWSLTLRWFQSEWYLIVFPWIRRKLNFFGVLLDVMASVEHCSNYDWRFQYSIVFISWTLIQSTPLFKSNVFCRIQLPYLHQRHAVILKPIMAWIQIEPQSFTEGYTFLIHILTLAI